MLVMLSLSTYSLTTCTGITLCRPPICIQYTHTDTFDGHFSGTTQVSHKASQYHKGKTSLDFTEARDIEWQ